MRKVFTSIILLFCFTKLMAIEITYKVFSKTNIAIVKANNSKGTILFLNGYNFSIDKAIEESNFIKMANNDGYTIVIPEVSKTIYALQNYPETKPFLLNQKKRLFYCDSLIEFLKNEKLLDSNFFIYGISTGARGAFFMGSHLKEKVRALALLSGDYDQCINTKDNLMVSAFGEFEKFEERWKKEENPMYGLKDIECKIFIFHGKKDKIVPFEHSIRLKKALENAKKECFFNENSDLGHDFTVWNRQSMVIIDFFNRNLQK